MSSARVTVCIPTYNRAHFLHQALHSLCDQGLARHEYVVAVSDNCSDDKTPAVVEEYRNRLQIIYHRNPETVCQRENWSVAASLCKTPFLALLSDDDLLAPGQLGRALSTFDAHESAVLVSSPTVKERYPGDPKAGIRGVFLRATAQTSFSEPYVWDMTEWLALSLIGPPLSSIVGSVFQHESFSRCELPKRRQKGDWLLLAEMALHGDVLSLPWIGGYIRKHEHRSSRLSGKAYRYENVLATRDILEMCEKRNLPVLEFWVDQACLSKPVQRRFYLSELKKKLPSYAYTEIQDAVEERLSTKPVSTKPAGRLDWWGISRCLADPLRAVRGYLSK